MSNKPSCWSKIKPEEDTRPVIVVWFSCGAASAVALKKTLELYWRDYRIVAVNNYIKEEDEDNRRFLRDVEKWCNIKIEIARNSKFPNCSVVEVWDKRKFMSSPHGAPCTYELKKKARMEWEERNTFNFLVMGFTYDEIARHERFKMFERDNILPVLISQKITKKMCYEIINEAGIALPESYKKGYPNANCPGCVKATSPTYWNLVRIVDPEVFREREIQSRKIGAKLAKYKGKRLFLDELPPDAKGRALKNMDFECGIFCEEKL